MTPESMRRIDAYLSFIGSPRPGSFAEDGFELGGSRDSSLYYDDDDSAYDGGIAAESDSGLNDDVLMLREEYSEDGSQIIYYESIER